MGRHKGHEDWHEGYAGWHEEHVHNHEGWRDGYAGWLRDMRIGTRGMWVDMRGM